MKDSKYFTHKMCRNIAFSLGVAFKHALKKAPVHSLSDTGLFIPQVIGI